MNKDELSKLISIKGEIKQIEKELKSIVPDYTKDSVTGSDTNFPYIAHQVKIEGYDYNSYFKKIKRIESRLNKKLHELITEKDNITEYIYNNINDSELRQILMYRFVEGKDCKEIGECMGWSGRTIERRIERWSKSCR